MSVFVQPMISHFRESKLALDDAERVFHLCPDPGFVSVPGAFNFGQLPVAATLRLGEVFRLGSVISDGLFLTAVRRISPNASFLSMEQVGQNLRVANVGRSSDNGVNKPCTTVDADMGLHAKVSLIAFARLAHLRVALFLFVLGGTWRIDNAGVNDGAAGDLHSVVLEILIHRWSS